MTDASRPIPNAPATAPGEPATAAALRELLSTPAVKALLGAGRPTRLADAAPRVVKTLLWSDVDVSLSLASDLPDLVNALFETLATLGEEIGRLPDPLLAALVTDRLAAIDRQAARRAVGAWIRLALRLAPTLTASLPTGKGPQAHARTSGDDTSTVLAKALGSGLLAPLFAEWNRWLEEHPGGLRRLANALLAPVDPDALGQGAERTAQELAGVLRDHPALGQALARLVGSLAWEALQGSLRSVGTRLRSSGRSVKPV